jgi:hypothetical protein
MYLMLIMYFNAPTNLSDPCATCCWLLLSRKNNNGMNNIEKEVYVMAYDVEKLRILNIYAQRVYQ